MSGEKPMNRGQNVRKAQELPDGVIDRVLVHEDALLPSSGFAAAVMDAIRQEAAAPQPIPFPWKRAIPGLVALLDGLFFMIRLGVSVFSTPDQIRLSAPGWAAHLVANPHAATVLHDQAGPVALAIGLSLVCVLLCRSLLGTSPAR